MVGLAWLPVDCVHVYELSELTFIMDSMSPASPYIANRAV